MSSRALSRVIPFDLRPLAGRVYGVVRQVPNLIVFAVIAVIGGFGSSWYMIDQGSPLTTRSYGPWTMWTGAGRADTDPYTRAHYIRRGMLAESSSISETYFAKRDASGQILRAYCDYYVYGLDPDAESWSLAAYTSNGRLIANRAGRYAFNSSTIMRGAGGRFIVAVSRDAQPGNWLPVGGASNLTLVLTIHMPRAHANDDASTAPALPVIEQVRCK
jgi:hypothetical protein